MFGMLAKRMKHFNISLVLVCPFCVSFAAASAEFFALLRISNCFSLISFLAAPMMNLSFVVEIALSLRWLGEEATRMWMGINSSSASAALGGATDE